MKYKLRGKYFTFRKGLLMFGWYVSKGRPDCFEVPLVIEFAFAFWHLRLEFGLKKGEDK